LMRNSLPVALVQRFVRRRVELFRNLSERIVAFIGTLAKEEPKR